MTTRTRGRRSSVFLVSVSAALAVTLLGACATPAPTRTSGLGVVGAGPSGQISGGSPPATPSTPATNPTGSTTTPPVTGNYPKTAQGYADATLTAWAAHATSRLNDLTDATAQAGFAGTVGRGSIDKHWHLHTCDGTAGSTYCSYDNDDGDRARLRVVDALLGMAHGVQEMVFDGTRYGPDADTVVNGFMQAWKDGNRQRMVSLGNATVTSYFTHFAPQDTWAVADDTSVSGHVRVRITNPAGFDTTVDVTIAKIGQAHSISKVCTTPTCT